MDCASDVLTLITIEQGFRRYFKKLYLRYKTQVLERNSLQVKILKDLETKYVLSGNAILNPSGKYKLQSWKIAAKGGYVWNVTVWNFSSFVISYGKDRSNALHRPD